MTDLNSYGFIITRHVNSEMTNKYWNNCVKLLRTLYPFRQIVIIDDNSNPIFLKADFDYKNLQIIHSEFKGRGELLPYYYYIKNKFFKNAIILHDSVFFHMKIDFDDLVKKCANVLPLWFFYADKENVDNTFRLSYLLKNNNEIQKKLSLNELVLGMPKDKWYGCFGVQSFINHTFLCKINAKYNLCNLLNGVRCRADRCCLERIFGIIFFTESKSIHKNKSLLGDIMKYQKWGYSYKQYQEDVKKGQIPKTIIKVWTGR